MAMVLWLLAAATFAVDVSLSSCRDDRECSGLIAKAIVAGAKACWLRTHAPQSDAHFSQCLSDFCSTKCSQDEQCCALCKKKGHGIYDKVGSFLQIQIASAMDNPDELEELREENPNAYAIVKALLTKRTLGLLNPAHPSASFSNPRGEEDGAPAVQSVGSFAHKDWLNWKPADHTALVDDVMSTNLRGSSSNRNDAQEISSDPNRSSSWASMFSAKAQVADSAPETTNPYLANTGWSETVRPVAPHQNPYLVDFAKSPTQEALVAETTTSSYLKDLE